MCKYGSDIFCELDGLWTLSIGVLRLYTSCVALDVTRGEVPTPSSVTLSDKLNTSAVSQYGMSIRLFVSAQVNIDSGRISKKLP